MYKQIMVPLDGSTFAEAALPAGLALSRMTAAPLHLVSVVEPLPAMALEDWVPAAEKWTADYLVNLSGELAPHAGGAVTMSAPSGAVVERLQDEVTRSGADLIVMASHGRGALSRFWLGSVADRFIRQADRPILVIKPADDEPVAYADAPVALQRLLVPLDGSALSESALEHATRFGALFGASYHLTRVISAPQVGRTGQMNQSMLEQFRAEAVAYLESQAERLTREGLQVTSSVAVHSQPGSGVLFEADEQGCDGIVMATHGHRGLRRALLGSTADKVLRGTRLPLLLYRPTD